jgi:hypothetical protein
VPPQQHLEPGQVGLSNDDRYHRGTNLTPLIQDARRRRPDLHKPEQPAKAPELAITSDSRHRPLTSHPIQSVPTTSEIITEDQPLWQLGLDPTEMQHESAMLRNWIAALDADAVHRMVRNLDRLEIVEQAVSQFRGRQASQSGIIQVVGEAPTSSVQVGNVFFADAPTVLPGAHPTLGQQLDLQNCQSTCYDEARAKGVSELAVSSAHSYPPEAAARAIVQAALLEIGHPELRLSRLELSTADPWGKTQRNYQALTALRNVARQELTRRSGESAIRNTPAPKDHRPSPFAQDEPGCYVVQGLKRQVVTYNPPGNGYWHIAQGAGHDCGLIVHDAMTMFYSAGDSRLLSDKDELDTHIRKRAMNDKFDPDAGRRTTLYRFADLASYSKVKDEHARRFDGAVPAFEAFNGTISAAHAKAGTATEIKWWGRSPRLDLPPLIGVTTNHWKRDETSGNQILVQHNVQLGELDGHSKTYVAIDSLSNPNSPGTANEYTLIPAKTMSQALLDLLQRKSNRVMGDYSFELYLPTERTRANRPRAPLPQVSEFRVDNPHPRHPPVSSNQGRPSLPLPVEDDGFRAWSDPAATTRPPNPRAHKRERATKRRKDYSRQRHGGVSPGEERRQREEINRLVPDPDSTARVYYSKILDFKERYGAVPNPSEAYPELGGAEPWKWDPGVMKKVAKIDNSAASEIHRRRDEDPKEIAAIRKFMDDAGSPLNVDRFNFAYNASRHMRGVWTVAKLASAARLSPRYGLALAATEDAKLAPETQVVKDYVKSMPDDPSFRYREARKANILENWNYPEPVLEVGAGIEMAAAATIRRELKRVSS